MATIDQVIESIWTRYDFDQNGTLNQEEAEQLFLDISANRPELNLAATGFQAWFQSIDGDNDKTISRDELKGYLQGINYTHLHSLQH